MSYCAADDRPSVPSSSWAGRCCPVHRDACPTLNRPTDEHKRLKRPCLTCHKIEWCKGVIRSLLDPCVHRALKSQTALLLVIPRPNSLLRERQKPLSSPDRRGYRACADQVEFCLVSKLSAFGCSDERATAAVTSRTSERFDWPWVCSV